jgi:hypothetical protein
MNPKHPAGPPMTLGNMRELGVGPHKPPGYSESWCRRRYSPAPTK